MHTISAVNFSKSASPHNVSIGPEFWGTAPWPDKAGSVAMLPSVAAFSPFSLALSSPLPPSSLILSAPAAAHLIPSQSDTYHPAHPPMLARSTFARVTDLERSHPSDPHEPSLSTFTVDQHHQQLTPLHPPAYVLSPLYMTVSVDQR